MQVHIIYSPTQCVVATLDVMPHGLSHAPTSADYANEAWRLAVEGGLVETDARDRYEFNFADEAPGI
ncbi:MAG: hypothetical protein QM639_09610 [Rhodocyclaceae bacterium]